ncbi:MAG: hypothetical protein PWQ37_197 [Candidatus Petromonas sp.]|jgi:regulatory protein YycI of two-component signal transduction system YycFG|nr:hypothetical protein [Candidatus Petromonas sp.]
MDWSKAKNILIIAFIITNIFLGLSIFKNMKQYNYFYSVNGQRIKDVISILEEKDIIVKTDVPKDVPKLPALTVKYETYNGNEMAEKFLETYIEKDKEYVKGNESVKVTFNNKLLIYERKPEIFSLKDISQEQAKKIADSFIEKYGFSGKNVEHWSTTKEQYDEYKIIYKQKYNDMFLNDSEMKVIVNNTGVVRFERKWLQPKVTKMYEKRVIPATKALLMVIDKIKRSVNDEDDKAVITSIRLGYSFEISEIDTLANREWHNMESGEVLPYWIICLENNEFIYVEAYE